MARTKLSNLSIAELKQEIERRQKLLPKLIAQRDALNREIEALQDMKAENSAAAVLEPAKRPRHRGQNKASLADLLAQVMQDTKKVTVAEAMQGVLDVGYKTKSKNFRSVVNNMLLTDKRFKKVGRGEFVLRK